MYDYILKQLERRKEPINLIIVGLGFMGFGFFSLVRKIPGFCVPLIITRRVQESKEFLEKKGYKVKIVKDSEHVNYYAKKEYVCISSSLDVLKTFKNAIVIETTGTVDYGTQVAEEALSCGKHLVTFNPDLQVSVGTQLKRLADAKGLVFTDITGDQPGSISRMISQARLMGFEIVMAGNMKRFMNIRATQRQMQPWADSKGINVVQTTSFTDGSKQAIELSLVANYFGLGVIKRGMVGPTVEGVSDILNGYDFKKIPKDGVVDFAVGKNLYPGEFIICTHPNPEQINYLKYLSLGAGPYYLLFEPNHLCHLEAVFAVAKVALFGQETINNSAKPTTTVISVAKSSLKKGQILDGVGGDLSYGVIDTIKNSKKLLPIGLSSGAVLKHDIPIDSVIKLSDVKLADNAATRLAGLVKSSSVRVVPKFKRHNEIQIVNGETLHVLNRKTRGL